MRRVAVLGNGLSISASDQFEMATLTTRVRNELAQVAVGDTNLRDVLDRAGRHIVTQGYDPTANFEHLLGPLDRMALMLREDLLAVSEMVGHEDVFEEAADRLRDLYYRGVAAVLRAVDAAAATADMDRVRDVMDWVHVTPGATEVSIYTPNYDSLPDRALLAAKEERYLEQFDDPGLPDIRFDDEFSGQAPTRVVTVGGHQITVLPARAPGEGRIYAVHLYHLHGGMHWLADAQGLCKPQDIDRLRDANAWGRWMADLDTHLRPQVILTDQKTTAVTRPPFDASYRALRADLLAADRVFIAGYGLGDEPLNVVLRETWASPHGNPEAIWLVVGRPGSEASFGPRVSAVFDPAGTGTLPAVSYAGLPAVVNAASGFWEAAEDAELDVGWPY